MQVQSIFDARRRLSNTGGDAGGGDVQKGELQATCDAYCSTAVFTCCLGTKFGGATSARFTEGIASTCKWLVVGGRWLAPERRSLWISCTLDIVYSSVAVQQIETQWIDPPSISWEFLSRQSRIHLVGIGKERLRFPRYISLSQRKLRKGKRNTMHGWEGLLDV